MMVCWWVQTCSAAAEVSVYTYTTLLQYGASVEDR